MLSGFLAAYILWQMPTIVDDATRGVASDGLGIATTLLASVAGIVCLAYGVRWVKHRKAIQLDRRAGVALHDERIRGLIVRSYGFGFWTLGAFLLGVRILSFVTSLDAAVMAQIGVALGVSAPIARFLYLDRG